MGGAYGTPCSGELQFWTVMQAQMREQSKQLARIASILETGHSHEEQPAVPAAVDCAKLRKAISDAIDTISAWNSDGSMPYSQYNWLFGLLDSALAAIPEAGADLNKDNKED